MEVKRWIPIITGFGGYQGMGGGTNDGYGRSWVLYTDYLALQRDSVPRAVAEGLANCRKGTS